jgi:hypothetical protein
MTTVRRTGAASAAMLSGLALALGFSHAVAPEWVRRVGLDVWNLPAECETLRESDAKLLLLQQRHEQLLREIEFADHLTVRLADGMQTLADAVAELEPILQHRSGFPTVEYRNAPTFRHQVALHMIDRVRLLLAHDPTRLAAVTPRLEADYAAFQ